MINDARNKRASILPIQSCIYAPKRMQIVAFHARAHNNLFVLVVGLQGGFARTSKLTADFTDHADGEKQSNHFFRTTPCLQENKTVPRLAGG
jgi:hypothetical protein